MFFQFYNAFIQQRTKLDSNVSSNFQEMIFKIDEHRGKLKRKIDLIASNMIDETRNFEKIYLNNLKERFSSFDDCTSLVIRAKKKVRKKLITAGKKNKNVYSHRYGLKP